MRAVPDGYAVAHEIVVTPAMTVHFDELGSLHPVYSTYQMARHFEEAGRKILLPHLEAGEEGIGSRVEVEHTTSALVGMRVTIHARFERMEGRRLVASMTATSELGDRIGHGTTVQVILPRERIEGGFARLEARWRERRERLSRPHARTDPAAVESQFAEDPKPDGRDSRDPSDHDD